MYSNNGGEKVGLKGSAGSDGERGLDEETAR